MFILNDAMCAEDYNGTVEQVHEVLKQQGAEIVDSRKWEEGKLSYPINRQTRGVYVLFHFNAAPESIAVIERQLGLKRDVVLRELIVVDEDGVTLGTEKEHEKAAREKAEQERAERAAAREAEAAQAEQESEESEEEPEKESEESEEEAGEEAESADESEESEAEDSDENEQSDEDEDKD
jgi:ribosomal protein S6